MCYQAGSMHPAAITLMMLSKLYHYHITIISLSYHYHITIISLSYITFISLSSHCYCWTHLDDLTHTCDSTAAAQQKQQQQHSSHMLRHTMADGSPTMQQLPTDKQALHGLPREELP
jgi:hypothetical protein